MSEYEKLYEMDENYVLQFERSYEYRPEGFFHFITEPGYFTQWYPSATGEMDLRESGKIAFDDGEGAKFEGVITVYDSPCGICL